jgi:transposase
MAEASYPRRFAPYRQFLKFCGMSLSTQQTGRFRGIIGIIRLSEYGNARLRITFWMAAKTAVRMRENSLRPNAYSAVAAKLARIVYGLIKNVTDYRPFFEEAGSAKPPQRHDARGLNHPESFGPSTRAGTLF